MVSTTALYDLSLCHQLHPLFLHMQVEHSIMFFWTVCQQPTFFVFAGDKCDCPSGFGAFVLLVHAATLLQKAGQGVKAGC